MDVITLCSDASIQKILVRGKFLHGIFYVGDNVIVGSREGKLCWFDMDLSSQPYRILRYFAHCSAIIILLDGKIIGITWKYYESYLFEYQRNVHMERD